MLDLLAHQPRLAVRLTVLTINLEGERKKERERELVLMYSAHYNTLCGYSVKVVIIYFLPCLLGHSRAQAPCAVRRWSEGGCCLASPCTPEP